MPKSSCLPQKNEYSTTFVRRDTSYVLGGTLSDRSSPKSVEELNGFSRDLHGHRYVFPVAAWILKREMHLVSTRDAMEALGGRADRARALEALERLSRLGALTEMPRDSRINSPREFERRVDPYWDYVSTKLQQLDLSETWPSTGIQARENLG